MWINAIKTHLWKVNEKLDSTFSDLYNDSQEKKNIGFQSSKVAPGFKKYALQSKMKNNT